MAPLIRQSGSVYANLSRQQLVALTTWVCEPPLPQVTSQARLESDVRGPLPGSTAGFHQELQALGGPDGYPAVPSVAQYSVS